MKQIFILGNGFDLAHNLPTEYIHFMEAMDSILESDNKELGFDELFNKRLTSKDSFFLKTKELYKTEELILDTKKVSELKGALQNNSWFQYFKNNLDKIDSWIDFEEQIKRALDDLTYVLEQNIRINDLHVSHFFTNETLGYKFELYKDLFFYMGLYQEEISLNNSFKTIPQSKRKHRNSIFLEKYINKVNKRTLNNYGDIINSSIYLGLNEETILNKIVQELYDFNEIFSKYLTLIIHKLNPKKEFIICRTSSSCNPNPMEFHSLLDIEVYSFNYTNTFERFYYWVNDEFDRTPNKMEYLHGKVSNSEEDKDTPSNIVLGVDEVNQKIKELKIFDFTKSHQKIVKQIRHSFLKNHNMSIINEFNECEIIIWGHSLDISDKEYIKEIFSLIENKHIKITVFYHDTPNALVSNLMSIMGQEFISECFKNKSLSFERAPEIKQKTTDK